MEAPYYITIAKALETEISAGRFRPGDKLPTEAELCESYRVARGTARQAVSELCARGLAHREHGRGTFVNIAPTELHMANGRFLSILEELTASGAPFETTFARLDRVRPDETLCRVLALSPEDEAFALRRVRALSGCPAMLSVNWFSAALCGNMEVEPPDFRLNNLALYDVFRTRCRLTPAAAERSFEAVAADADAAEALMIPRGSPLLLVGQLTLDERGRPIDYAQIRLRSELVHLSASMRR